jgi:hypothetical protein
MRRYGCGKQRQKVQMIELQRQFDLERLSEQQPNEMKD